MNLLDQDTHPLSDSRTEYDRCKLAYAAGYFDGEGCIWMGNGSTNSLVIGITSGDYKSLLIFCELFGGNVLPCKDDRSRVNLFRWRKFGPGAVSVLHSIAPFMRAKKDQAELVIASMCTFNCKRGYGNLIDPLEFARRNDLRLALRKAKEGNYK